MGTDNGYSKTALIALALSVLLPGAGLAYLGKWRSAAINLLLAIALVGGTMLFGPKELNEHIHYLHLVIAVGSGAWAHAAAQRGEEN